MGAGDGGGGVVAVAAEEDFKGLGEGLVRMSIRPLERATEE